MTGAHPFDNAIHLDTIDENVKRGRTDPEWERDRDLTDQSVDNPWDRPR